MTTPVSLSPAFGCQPTTVQFSGRKKSKPKIEMPFAEARERLAGKGFDATVTDGGFLFRKGAQEILVPKRGPDQLIPSDTALKILNATA